MAKGRGCLWSWLSHDYKFCSSSASGLPLESSTGGCYICVAHGPCTLCWCSNRMSPKKTEPSTHTGYTLLLHSLRVLFASLAIGLRQPLQNNQRGGKGPPRRVHSNDCCYGSDPCQYKYALLNKNNSSSSC